MKEHALASKDFSLLVKILNKTGCPIPQYGLQTSHLIKFNRMILKGMNLGIIENIVICTPVEIYKEFPKLIIKNRQGIFIIM